MICVLSIGNEQKNRRDKTEAAKAGQVYGFKDAADTNRHQPGLYCYYEWPGPVDIEKLRQERSGVFDKSTRA